MYIVIQLKLMIFYLDSTGPGEIKHSLDNQNSGWSKV